MACEGTWHGDASDPVKRLREQILRLGDLRREGLHLVTGADAEAVATWYLRWALLLNAIRTHLDCEVPRQAELVLWPTVKGSRRLEQSRVELVRAAVGCRELELLVEQLLGPQADALATSEQMPPATESIRGSSFVFGGQRFEGAVRLRQLIEAARASLFIVDPYVAAGTFTLAAAAPDGIQRRFLSSNHRGVRREVTEAWAEWRENWRGVSECRLGSELPHFRLLFIDKAAYHVDASLKDFGSKWTFFRMLPTDELRQLEGTIDSLWQQAVPI